MARRRSDQGMRNVARFYRYSIPYWKLVVLSIIAMSVSAAMTANVVVLIRPATKALQRREAEARGEVVPPQPAARRDGKADSPAMPQSLKATQKKVERWLQGLTVVKKLKQWFYPGADLQRIAFVLAFIVGPLLLISGFVSRYVEGVVVWHIMADLRVALFERISRRPTTCSRLRRP